MTQTRKRLLLYYNERGRNSGIRISLPVGSYIPKFQHGHEESDDLANDAGSPASHLRDAHVFVDTDREAHQLPPITLVPGSRTSHSALPEEAGPIPSGGRNRTSVQALLWLALAGVDDWLACGIGLEISQHLHSHGCR